MAYSERPNLGLIPIDRMPRNGGPNFNSLLRELIGNIDQMDRRLRWIVLEPQHEPTSEVPYPTGIVCIRSDAGAGSSPNAFYIEKSWPTNSVYAAKPFDEILKILGHEGFAFYNGVDVDSVTRCMPGQGISPGGSVSDFERAKDVYRHDFYNRTGIGPDEAFLVGSRITWKQIIEGRVDYESLPINDVKIQRERLKAVGLEYLVLGLPDGERPPCLTDIHQQQAQQHARRLKRAA